MSANDLTSLVYPQFFPAHWLDNAPDIVHSPFPSRIRIGYVLRHEGNYQYLTAPQLKESGLSLRALHEAALGNLDDLPMPNLTIAKTPGGPEAFLGEADDNFTAVRILVPRVQCELRCELGEEFLAILPCRDWMLCWSSSQSKEWQTKNAVETLRIFHSDEYNLTPDILLFTATGVCIHQAQDVECCRRGSHGTVAGLPVKPLKKWHGVAIELNPVRQHG